MTDLMHFLVVPVLLAGAILIRSERRRAISRNLDTLESAGFVMSEVFRRAHPVVAVDHDNGRVAVVTAERFEIFSFDADDLPAPAKACLPSP